MFRYLILLTMLSKEYTSQRTILAGNNSSPLIQSDTRVRLSCRTDTQWFFCLWHSPSEDIQCAIQYDQPTSVCKENPRVQLVGGSTYCDIIIQVKPEDHGNWMCLVNDLQNFDAKKKFIHLNVGIESKLQMSIEGGSIEDGLINTVEGDTVDLRCSAHHGFPAPTLTWFGPPRQQQGNAIKVYQASTERDPGSYTGSVMQRVRYIPTIDDNNRTISCMVMQSLEGITHYTRTLSYRLQVEKRPVSPGGPLIQGISVVSGVLILFILALLACTLLVALLVKQRGRKKKRNKIIRAREEENSLFDEDHDDMYIGGTSTPRCLSQNYNEYRNHLSDCNGVPINRDFSQTFAAISKSGVPTVNPSSLNKSPGNGVMNGSKPNNSNGNGKQVFKSEKEVVCQVLPKLESPVKPSRLELQNAENPRKHLEGILQNDAADCTNCENARDYYSQNSEIPQNPSNINTTDFPEDKFYSHKSKVHSHNDGYQTYQKNRSSSYLSRSLSTSDLSISYSAEDLTKSCRLLTSHFGEEMTSEYDEKPVLSPGSVPHLDRLPCRTLVNPTKSLISLSAKPVLTQTSKRRRRKTGPTYKSTNSVFDCDEGCFSKTDSQQQMVIITTGPVIL